MDNIKLYLGSTGSIIAVIAALFTIDARYAHAEAVAKEIATTQQVIKETTQNIRKQSLEDKLFEIDLKRAQKQITPTDEALRYRYQRLLNEMDPKK